MNYHEMDNFEEVKRIKWIIKQMAEEIEGSGFSIKFASLYLEEDEDAEVWKEHVKEWSRDHWSYETLILFVMVMECDYFRFKLVITENESRFQFNLYESGHVLEDNEPEATINSIVEMRNILSSIFNYCGYGFTQHSRTTKKAYENLLKDFEKIGIQM